MFSGIGKSAIIAQKITATLNSTGQKAVFMHATDAMHGDLGIIDEEDSCPDERGPESNNGCMYEVKCPYCENYFKVEVIETWKDCNYCGNRFYTCRKSNGDYGIRQEWIQDGGCDCSNCNDEEGYD